MGEMSFALPPPVTGTEKNVPDVNEIELLVTQKIGNVLQGGGISFEFEMKSRYYYPILQTRSLL